MSEVPLTDDTKIAIFSDQFRRDLEALDQSSTCHVWNRLRNIFTSMVPIERFIHERVSGAEELEVIRAGDQLRLYCKLVDWAAGFELLNLFGIHKHDYSGWAPYDRAAQQRVRHIRERETRTLITEFLEEQTTLEAEDIEQGRLELPFVDEVTRRLVGYLEGTLGS